MRFAGRIYFDFVCPYVNRLSHLLGAAEREGAELEIEWRPFSLEQVNASDPEVRFWEQPERSRYGAIHALATYEWVRATHSYAQEAYRRALLFVRHDEEGDFTDWQSYAGAAGVAGLNGDELIAAVRDEREGYAAVGDSFEGARERGVFGVPSLLRGDSAPLFVKLRPPALDGHPLRYLEMLDLAVEDEGLWELKKPS